MSSLKYKTNNGYVPILSNYATKTNAEHGNGIGTCSTSSGTALAASLTGYELVLNGFVSEANDSDKTLSMQYDVAGLVSSVILARKIVEQEETIKLQNTRIKEHEKIVDDIQKELDKQKL